MPDPGTQVAALFLDPCAVVGKMPLLPTSEALPAWRRHEFLLEVPAQRFGWECQSGRARNVPHTARAFPPCGGEVVWLACGLITFHRAAWEPGKILQPEGRNPGEWEAYSGACMALPCSRNQAGFNLLSSNSYGSAAQSGLLHASMVITSPWGSVPSHASYVTCVQVSWCSPGLFCKADMPALHCVFMVIDDNDASGRD